MRSVYGFNLLLFLFLLLGTASAQTPVKIIFDTDMDTDVDDAGALAMLHALADNGEAEILATVVSSLYPWSAPTAAAINRYYGRDDLPIGSPKGEGAILNRPYRYPKEIAQEFPHPRIKTNDDAEDAVRLYRRILTAQPDKSVVVLTVGYMTNLSELLRSGPDSVSPLSGRDLAAQKVQKWVCMGGRYPLHVEPRAFGNFKPDPDAIVHAAQEWPTQIVFCGLGEDVLTGFPVRTLTPSENPVRRAYELYLGPRRPTRPSWDQVALLYAVRGAGELFSLHEAGYNHIFEDGTNVWRLAPNRENHVLLQMKGDPQAIATLIDDLMIQPPARRTGAHKGRAN